MPVWLRVFYYKSVAQAMKDEASANEKASKSNNSGVKRPNFRK